ncbi:MAG: GAF domain-containing protein, partial [Anaerolineae bacterium]|nr:GAF domain-containing protein [Anaerolineae bacterium]
MRVKGTLATQIAIAIQNARSFEQLQQAQTALREREEIYRALASNFPNGFILLYDHELRYRLADGLGLSETGLSKQAIEGKTIYEVWSPEVTQAVEPQYVSALVGETTVTEIALDSKIYQQFALPVRDEQGQIVFGMVMAQDVTAARQAQREMQRTLTQLNTLYENSVDMIGIADLESGMFIELNPSWEKTLGYTRAELMAEPFINFVHPDDREQTIREWELERSIGKATSSFINRYRTKNGSYRTFSWNASTSPDKRYAYFVVRDVTDDIIQKQIIERRARELATVAEVSAAATQLLDIDNLLQRAVDLAKERFELYHVHIYLLDDDGVTLRMRAGSGRAGALMKAHGRRISINHPHSIVALAARERRSVTVNDVTVDPNFLPNPLLPETRAELAVPLIVGEELLGVLDVQSDQVGRFTDEDVLIQTTLADQLAVAVQNARQFAQSQEDLLVLNATSQISAQLRSDEPLPIAMEYILDSLLPVFKADSAAYFEYDHARQTWHGVASVGIAENVQGLVVARERYQHGVEALETQQVLVVSDAAEYPHFPPEDLHSDNPIRSVMVVPIVLQEQAQGAIFLNYTGMLHRFTTRQRDLAQSFADQISFGLENRRLEQAARQAFEETARIYENSADLIGVAGLSDGYLKRLNPAWMRTLGWSFEELTSRPYIEFIHPEDVRLTVEEAQRQMTERGVSVSFINRFRTKAGSYRTLSWNAQLDQAEDRVYFVARDITESIKQQQALERRANELAVVAELSAAAATVLDIDQLLQNFCDLAKERFNLYHVHVYLYDPEHDSLVLTAGAGEVGRIMRREGRRIRMNSLRSIVARAARERRGVIVNDIALDDSFLPNPLLPETRAELAVPMIVGDQLIGVLDVQSDVVDRFDEEDVRIKTALADQIAVAVQNARLYQQQVQVAEEARKLDRLKNEFLA